MNLEKLNQFIDLVPVQAMPKEAGVYYGKTRTSLEKKGHVIGSNDLWIAAHARALGLTLITNNTKEFSRVGELVLENWV